MPKLQGCLTAQLIKLGGSEREAWSGEQPPVQAKLGLSEGNGSGGNNENFSPRIERKKDHGPWGKSSFVESSMKCTQMGQRGGLIQYQDEEEFLVIKSRTDAYGGQIGERESLRTRAKDTSKCMSTRGKEVRRGTRPGLKVRGWEGRIFVQTRGGSGYQ